VSSALFRTTAQTEFVAKQVRKIPGSSKLQNDLKLLRKKIKSKIRHEAKEQGLKALVSKNPREQWNFINMATFTAKAGDDSLPPLSTLNEYFASVVQSTRPTVLTVPSGCNTANSFQLSILSYSEVIKAIFNHVLYSSRS